MNTTAYEPDPAKRWRARLEPTWNVTVRAFHRYANWLVSISWRKFVLLSILLLVLAAVVKELPPFSWTLTETIAPKHAQAPEPPAPPAPPAAAPAPPKLPRIVVERSGSAASGAKEGLDISIDETGIRVRPKGAAKVASGASGTLSGDDAGEIIIRVPEGADRETVRQAIEDVKQALRDLAQSRKDVADIVADADRHAREVARHAEAAVDGGFMQRTTTLRWGDSLPELALLWIIASAILKATYKRSIQAEAKAAQATEVAEEESLKRQVVEARMAAMQAQVEPHFLFNTLASIEHLIETDPARASQMQRNLIALLRASMPTMREANASGVRDLGREVAVIKPYLEILKVRMEERLRSEIDIPEGLHSAEFPPMMIQSLVENAIKHGLEPKPEGGTLKVKAEIVHGKLQVTVADTGVGFGRAATAGTGVGLANIRERLQLLYGGRASLTVTENPAGGGTVVSITVPYKTLDGGAST